MDSLRAQIEKLERFQMALIDDGVIFDVVRLADVLARLPVEGETESIFVSHARKQGAADGFQQGWHAALHRVREGDKIHDLAELVPQFSGGINGQSEGDVRFNRGQQHPVPDGLRAGRGEGPGEREIHSGNAVGRNQDGYRQSEGVRTVQSGPELLRGLQPSAVDEHQWSAAAPVLVAGKSDGESAPLHDLRQEHWSVSVSRNHDVLITIESNHMAGKADMTVDDERAIITAAEHLHGFLGQPRQPLADVLARLPVEGETNIEAARIRAYRQARIFEPSMEGYNAAMSVYVAAFGKHPGEVEIVFTQGVTGDRPADAALPTVGVHADLARGFPNAGERPAPATAASQPAETRWQSIEDLKAFSEQERESARGTKNRDQYQFYSGFSAALDRVRGSQPDVVCQHGTAMDVHCCNCHSGFIFAIDHECPAPPTEKGAEE